MAARNVAVQAGEVEGFVATITLTELACIYARKTDTATARLRVMQVQGSKLRLVPLSADIAVEAGILKRPEIFRSRCHHRGIGPVGRHCGCHEISAFSDMRVEVSGYPGKFRNGG